MNRGTRWQNSKIVYIKGILYHIITNTLSNIKIKVQTTQYLYFKCPEIIGGYCRASTSLAQIQIFKSALGLIANNAKCNMRSNISSDIENFKRLEFLFHWISRLIETRITITKIRLNIFVMYFVIIIQTQNQVLQNNNILHEKGN